MTAATAAVAVPKCCPPECCSVGSVVPDSWLRAYGLYYYNYIRLNCRKQSVVVKTRSRDHIWSQSMPCGGQESNEPARTVPPKHRTGHAGRDAKNTRGSRNSAGRNRRRWNIRLRTRGSTSTRGLANGAAVAAAAGSQLCYATNRVSAVYRGRRHRIVTDLPVSVAV